MAVGAEVTWRTDGPPAARETQCDIAMLPEAKLDIHLCYWRGACGQPVTDGRRSCQEHAERFDQLGAELTKACGAGRVCRLG
jgi:hypothetical protein